MLSQLNKHELALNHAMSAVILLQEMMLAKRLDAGSAQEEEDDLPAETSKDRTAVLAIAYHNMGVEQEFLRSYPAAILSYKKAVNFAEKNLGPEDGITQNLRNVFENAKVELDTALYKKGGKKKANRGRGKAAAEMDQYEQMMTPRNDMEKVEEEELGTDEQQQEYQENENQEEEHKAQ